jgi:hypothetical protein
MKSSAPDLETTFMRADISSSAAIVDCLVSAQHILGTPLLESSAGPLGSRYPETSLLGIYECL